MAGRSMKDIETLAVYKIITMAARYAHLAPDVAAAASEKIVADITAEASGRQNRRERQSRRRG